ncbi:S-glutathionyl-(chloro)hydroquinone reductase [Tulasnella sp. 408]|nr:S-glutathionyl-(chloro)hydroquinone reductase [Tulasnella sp. 408]
MLSRFPQTGGANPNARFTVPVLWDKKTETIVNNESSEIIRILNSAFNEFLPEDKANLDLYPEELRADIDGTNEWVFSTVNAGVYKAGFATSQSSYEEGVKPLFASLDRLEGILKDKEYLVGGRLTEADVRLFTTLIIADNIVPSPEIQCNIGSIRHNYPSLNQWMKRLYWGNPAFKDATDFHHIKTGYYGQKTNPTGIVPVGPIPPIEPL